MACKVVSTVSSKMTSCENSASKPTTTTVITVTKPATQSVSWVVNDVRIFCMILVIHFFLQTYTSF